jgi:putative transposase
MCGQQVLVGGRCQTAREMARHTTFQYCLDPTAEQQEALWRHCGAARFAFNQSLYLVKTNLDARGTNRDLNVPWSKYDLINEFNAWKRSADAGRIFVVDRLGVADIHVTGLSWRNQVSQQVFEEAAVDCARALAAWSDSRSGKRQGKGVRFPRFKKKRGSVPSFRLRNKRSRNGSPLIRLGEAHPRSVTLPKIGPIHVHDDTRALRRLIAKSRGRILSASVTHRGGRWWISLNVEAADLHVGHQHPVRDAADQGGWVGIDRGLSVFLVAATSDGTEIARVQESPKPLAAGLRQQKRLARKLSRTQEGSRNRQNAAARVGRHHHRVRNIRRHFLHQVSNELVKTHDRLVIEDLNVAGMVRNTCLSRAISDAGWSEFARLVRYKQAWRCGTVVIADRWFPSSRRCSQCGLVNRELTLKQREFICENGHRLDRDLNAAVNLAKWGVEHPGGAPDPQAGGRVINAHGREGAGQHPACVDSSCPDEVGTEAHAASAT